MKTISNEVIRAFEPCYDLSETGIPDNETLTVFEWVEKYREKVPHTDIVWLLARPHFITEQNLRLFTIGCAREVLKLMANPEPSFIAVCDIAEKYAKGKAPYSEVLEARKIAHAVYSQTEETYDRAASKESILYKAAYKGAIYAALLYEGPAARGAYACIRRAASARGIYSESMRLKILKKLLKYVQN